CTYELSSAFRAAFSDGGSQSGQRRHCGSARHLTWATRAGWRRVGRHFGVQPDGVQRAGEFLKMSSIKESVGFIGVGFMGQGMASNLLAKGFPLTVMGHRNRRPVEQLVAAGAKEAK